MLRFEKEITMSQILKHIQLMTYAVQRLFALQTGKRSAVVAICPSMHRMWAVAGYPVMGGGVV